MTDEQIKLDQKYEQKRQVIFLESLNGYLMK